MRFEVSRRELGIDGSARFFRLYRSGPGGYTRDRHEWLQGLRVLRTLLQTRTAGQAEN
jgi:hypothetical protein